MKSSIATVFALLVLIVVFFMNASLRHHRADQRQRQGGQSGQFDYYLLSLSWVPEFCHNHSDSPECQNGHYGFIVHGLWPQFVRGYTEYCSDAPGLSDPASVLDIMPDERLVQHEWQTHGSCSGLPAGAYFSLLRRAFTSVKIPPQFSELRQPGAMTPEEIKQAFVEANHGLSREDIAVSCGNNYLTGVSMCLSKKLDHVACTDVHDCRANIVKIAPRR